MHLSKSILLTLPMTLLLSVGCKKDSADSSPPEPVTTTPEPTPEPVAAPEPTPEPEPAAAPEPPPPPPLTDGEIATISKAANDGEIEHAKLAKTMAKDKKVKDFAAMMVKDHGDANKRQEALAKKEKIEPKDSEASKKLIADAAAQTEKLKATAKGAEFDRAYISGQVEIHTAVLDTIDKQMLPAAQNAALKAELEKVRGAVEMHLNKAKEILAALNPPAA